MFYALIASLLVALLSLIGVFFFGKKGNSQRIHNIIVPVAIGVFLGVVFFELIPETIESSPAHGPIAIAIGFLSFYALSHYLRTYHHHHEEESADDDCKHAQGASMLLIGDAVHNIADGVVIASAFLINPAVGIATTIGIALHEIPQEIAEYSVFMSAGYSPKKALMLNLLSASSIFIGVLATVVFASFGDFVWILTGLAAGNLLYIAASDMIPELHHTTHGDHFIKTFLSTIIGLIAIVSLLTWSHEYFGHHDETSDQESSLSQ